MSASWRRAAAWIFVLTLGALLLRAVGCWGDRDYGVRVCNHETRMLDSIEVALVELRLDVSLAWVGDLQPGECREVMLRGNVHEATFEVFERGPRGRRTRGTAWYVTWLRGRNRVYRIGIWPDRVDEE